MEYRYVGSSYNWKKSDNPRGSEGQLPDSGLVWDPIDVKELGEQYGLGVRGRQVGEILRKDVYQCAFCNGSGAKPRGSTCAVCRGKGIVSVLSPAMICAFCKGRGEERPRTNITCVVCRGRGVVPVKEPLEECRRCKGRGVDSHSKLPCVECKGKGVLTVKGEEP